MLVDTLCPLSAQAILQSRSSPARQTDILFVALNAFIPSQYLRAFISNAVGPDGRIRNEHREAAKNWLRQYRIEHLHEFVGRQSEALKQANRNLVRRSGADSNFRSVRDLKFSLAEINALQRFYFSLDAQNEDKFFPENVANENLELARSLISITRWPYVNFREGEARTRMTEWQTAVSQLDQPFGSRLLALRLRYSNGNAPYSLQEDLRNLSFDRIFELAFLDPEEAFYHLSLLMSHAASPRDNSVSRTKRYFTSSRDRSYFGFLHEATNWTPEQKKQFVLLGQMPDGKSLDQHFRDDSLIGRYEARRKILEKRPSSDLALRAFANSCHNREMHQDSQGQGLLFQQ
ncbi:MAG: hypothetical protein COV44_11690 [Deltaproteobacteria bacterium CG11_big_fil_rev_8_21_14_0_20_45_16]|nr:MAG: hypothetical protein COV44_11690 [Deltaproteobacteria bacterium CG11_big_fil_rev_8_21_14_0_20_45_16]